MNIDALPSPMDHSIIYMGAFNARHSALGGRSNTVSYSGTQVTKFIQHNHLTRWDTGGATHSGGGTFDHILTYGCSISGQVLIYAFLFSLITLPSAFSTRSLQCIHLPISAPVSVSLQSTALTIFPT